MAMAVEVMRMNGTMKETRHATCADSCWFFINDSKIAGMTK